MNLQRSHLYDLVPYPGRPRPHTHPDRLSTLAALLGMTPPPVEHCRVLEVGCGDGANIIPMAMGFPQAEFVGIDTSSCAIATGLSIREALGFANLQLLELDLADFPEAMGEFDYIIAHGFYSWVAPPLRERLLQIMEALLSPHGVAFVSYNTYPGCHIREMVREMMRYHVHNAPDPVTKISQARALLSFLVQARPGDGDPYDLLLRKELDRVLKQSDHHLFHDDLAPINQPFYFHEFMEQAGRHGMQYLCEAEYHTMQVDHISDAARKAMEALEENPVAREQYLDFLTCRRFRQTLLCRRTVRLDRDVRSERMQRFFFSSPARPVSENPDIASEAEETFAGPAGARMKTGHPLAKAVMVCLANAWPGALPFDQLLTGAAALHGRETNGEHRRLLGEILVQTFGVGLVQPHLSPARLSRSPGERPSASPLARLQIENGNFLTNLCHGTVHLEDPVACQVLRLLDGTRDREALMDSMEGFEGTIHEGQNRPEGTPASLREEKARVLEEVLGELARLALLLP